MDQLPSINIISKITVEIYHISQRITNSQTLDYITNLVQSFVEEGVRTSKRTALHGSSLQYNHLLQSQYIIDYQPPASSRRLQSRYMQIVHAMEFQFEMLFKVPLTDNYDYVEELNAAVMDTFFTNSTFFIDALVMFAVQDPLLQNVYQLNTYLTPNNPTYYPSSLPTVHPTSRPSSTPTFIPTAKPTKTIFVPSLSPSAFPTRRQTSTPNNNLTIIVVAVASSAAFMSVFILGAFWVIRRRRIRKAVTVVKRQQSKSSNNDDNNFDFYVPPPDNNSDVVVDLNNDDDKNQEATTNDNNHNVEDWSRDLSPLDWNRETQDASILPLNQNINGNEGEMSHNKVAVESNERIEDAFNSVVVGAFPNLQEQRAGVSSHKRGLSADFTANESEMHPADWSNYNSHDDMKHSLDNKAKASRTMTSRSYISNGTLTTGGGSGGTASSLIKDLMWIEKKIADQKKITAETQPDTTTPTISPRGENNKVSLSSPTQTIDSAYFSNLTAQESPLSTSSSPVSMKSIKIRDVEAPAGLLNVQIDSTSDGPTIKSVADDSPLRGQLFPGDLIVAIDNYDTRSLSAEALTAYIDQKQISNGKLPGGYKITVFHYDNEHMESNQVLSKDNVVDKNDDIDADEHSLLFHDDASPGKEQQHQHVFHEEMNDVCDPENMSKHALDVQNGATLTATVAYKAKIHDREATSDNNDNNDNNADEGQPLGLLHLVQSEESLAKE